jgi:hypothetical protein
VDLFPPPETPVSWLGARSSDGTTIVLDDEPMLVDEGSVVVEDAVVVATVEEPKERMPADLGDEDPVIEVGDEVVFDV